MGFGAVCILSPSSCLWRWELGKEGAWGPGSMLQSCLSMASRINWNLPFRVPTDPEETELFLELGDGEQDKLEL